MKTTLHITVRDHRYEHARRSYQSEIPCRDGAQDGRKQEDWRSRGKGHIYPR